MNFLCDISLTNKSLYQMATLHQAFCSQERLNPSNRLESPIVSYHCYPENVSQQAPKFHIGRNNWLFF